MFGRYMQRINLHCALILYDYLVQSLNFSILQHLCSDEDKVTVIKLAHALSNVTEREIDCSILDETDPD